MVLTRYNGGMDVCTDRITLIAYTHSAIYTWCVGLIATNKDNKQEISCKCLRDLTHKHKHFFTNTHTHTHTHTHTQTVAHIHTHVGIGLPKYMYTYIRSQSQYLFP